MKDQMDNVLLEEFSPEQIAFLHKIIKKYQQEPYGLIPLLEDVQDVLEYLPMSVLKRVSRKTNIPLSKIYGIVTFYAFFTMKPRGRHIIQVCMGTACYVRGSQEISQFIEKEYKIKPGETTPDKRFTYENIRCLGTCGLAPVIVVDGEVYGRVQSIKITEILDKYK
ncbi:MAG: NAD(P)H-dependent oxidoreductase subunit E [Atribacterota bacterium]